MIIEEKDLKFGELPVNKIVLGDAYKVLKKLPSNSIDAVVTDPPYGLEFMNQDWDRKVPPVRFWKEVLRVMKPGAHLLSFFGTRTYHRGVVNIEDAGFEIRDMVIYLHGQGFPKGQAIDKLIDKELGAYDKRKVVGVNPNVVGRSDDRSKGKVGDFGLHDNFHITEPATPEAKQWQGWNTALKPACEPIVLARKPLSEKNVARNVLKWGVGGLNVDACRIPLQDNEKLVRSHDNIDYKPSVWNLNSGLVKRTGIWENTKGRYPANVILDEVSAKMLDEQSGITKGDGKIRYSLHKHERNIYNNGTHPYVNLASYGDSGGASRFFYCAKAGRDERFAYCPDCDEVIPQKEWEKHKNHKLIFHTTVKPLKLMEYLVRLVTPPNGIEIDPIYCKIAEHRLKPYLTQQTLLAYTD